MGDSLADMAVVRQPEGTLLTSAEAAVAADLEQDPAETLVQDPDA
ncbi:hypothetical protein ABZ471_39905 [Streptomyces sp. NPDC005728]